jgi:drug/metabolite transporter (DMT)-like permease
MKKVNMLVALVLAATPVFAQGDNQNPLYQPEMLRIMFTIAIVIVFMVFILAIMKLYLGHRLKNKIVDKGLSENIATSILQTNPHEDRNSNIKWFLLMAGVGTGLLIVNYSQPLGIHSLAIMSLSISASFLAYYIFTRYTEK